jgi:hypothetical protein
VIHQLHLTIDGNVAAQVNGTLRDFDPAWRLALLEH